MQQSKELTEFYKAWLEWAEGDAVEGMPFARDVGLCGNLTEYLIGKLTNWEDITKVRDEVSLQFKVVYSTTLYPFGGEETYDESCWNKTMHLCTIRLQWVKDHIPV
jgi:hypothetical protein